MRDYEDIFKWTSWYVYGYCLFRIDFRLFKLNRMDSIAHVASFKGKREVPMPDLSNKKVFPAKNMVKAMFDSSMKWQLVEEYGVDSFTEMKNTALVVIDLQMIELEFEEDYTAINREVAGIFVAELKKECEDVLLDIREKCFKEECFYFAQTNRVADLIREKYGIEPERNKDGFGTNGVFRNPVTKKWVGLVMHKKRPNVIGDSEEKVVECVCLLDKIAQQKDCVMIAIRSYVLYTVLKR